jgi:hypothetical protein
MTARRLAIGLGLAASVVSTVICLCLVLGTLVIGLVWSEDRTRSPLLLSLAALIVSSSLMLLFLRGRSLRSMSLTGVGVLAAVLLLAFTLVAVGLTAASS